MSNAAQKTPISLLQELCATNGINPDYQLMSVEGAVHAPTFMYRVRVNDVVATATGQSKKKAKHAAAKAVLEILLSEDGLFKEGFVSEGVTVNFQTLNDVIAESVSAPPVDENCSKNPVGALQEMCMKMRWQPPYYETEKATGLPHEKVFSIMCMVDNFQTSGEGKSKRLAKRQAAENMLNRLKALNIISEDEEEAARGAKQPEDGVSNSTSAFCDRNSDEDELIIDCQNLSVNEGNDMRGSSITAGTSEYPDFTEEKIKNTDSAENHCNNPYDFNTLKLQLKFEDLKIFDKDDPDNFQSNLQKTYSKNVLKFLKDLKTSTSTCLQALQEIDVMDPQLDCPKLLQSIAAEQNFEIIYIPIEQRGKNGECHCLLQITSLPVAVCFGTAATKEDAMISSARNALNFIQLMCKK
ncbi:RISC-loading complex subunit tarbp2 like protein [Argiope bruennichi]|uniref:RISC-loading complex subunit tarbp2 like protein n=1 Tax=Argiope bruennichi TaxID=94029 RepID=A0A8T0FIL1_ARGBR|nr:RISC-loading complex subunit tarbp2 like protein [Argiope bruennichi]